MRLSPLSICASFCSVFVTTILFLLTSPRLRSNIGGLLPPKRHPFAKLHLRAAGPLLEIASILISRWKEIPYGCEKARSALVAAECCATIRPYSGGPARSEERRV